MFVNSLSFHDFLYLLCISCIYENRSKISKLYMSGGREPGALLLLMGPVLSEFSSFGSALTLAELPASMKGFAFVKCFLSEAIQF